MMALGSQRLAGLVSWGLGRANVMRPAAPARVSTSSWPRHAQATREQADHGEEPGDQPSTSSRPVRVGRCRAMGSAGGDAVGQLAASPTKPAKPSFGV